MGLHNEDADLWWRMALDHDVQCIPEELVGFRQSTNSISSQHLAAQMLASLYVQYLLVSHLTHRVPHSFSRIQRQLEKFVSPAKLQAKECLRGVNMHLASRRCLRAAVGFSAAIAASPSYVMERLYDEFVPFRRANPLVNGIPPKVFHDYRGALWG